MLNIGVESPTEISEADRISLRDQASKAAYQRFPDSPAQEITTRLLLYLKMHAGHCLTDLHFTAFGHE